jgi:hypothetical protein
LTSRVLFREKELVGRDAAVAAGVVDSLAVQLQQLSDHFTLARRVQAERRRIAVILQLVAEAVEAAVAASCLRGRFGVDLVEIGQDRVDGRSSRAARAA